MTSSQPERRWTVFRNRRLDRDDMTVQIPAFLKPGERIMVMPVDEHLAALEKEKAEREAAERDRDLAIAHDRQPYPTAEAYEKVCAARTKWQERAESGIALDRLREDDVQIAYEQAVENGLPFRVFLDSLFAALADEPNREDVLDPSSEDYPVDECDDPWSVNR